MIVKWNRYIQRCVKKTTDHRVFIKYTLVCAINN